MSIARQLSRSKNSSRTEGRMERAERRNFAIKGASKLATDVMLLLLYQLASQSVSQSVIQSVTYLLMEGDRNECCSYLTTQSNVIATTMVMLKVIVVGPQGPTDGGCKDVCVCRRNARLRRQQQQQQQSQRPVDRPIGQPTNQPTDQRSCFSRTIQFAPLVAFCALPQPQR